MTREKLEQLIDLREEIKQIERQIEDIQNEKTYAVKDKVQGSTRGWPYILTNKVITGYDTQATETRKLRIIKRSKLLEKRKKSAEELELEIMDFINSIQDSSLRRIFSLRYEQGCTWTEIGQKLGCDRTTAEKRIKKYLKKCEHT